MPVSSCINCLWIYTNIIVFLGLQFTEDGSFIGQYVPGKLNPPVSPHSIHQQPGTSGAATYV